MVFRVVGQCRSRHGTMESDETASLVYRDMECGDVRISDERLWIRFDQTVIDLRQDPREAVATAKAPDGVDRFVAECPVNVLDTLRVRSSEKSVQFAGVFPELRFQA